LPNDTIVEFEHSISAAMNGCGNIGRFADEHLIETLARRGYRFMVPVQFEELPACQPLPPKRLLPVKARLAGTPHHTTNIERLAAAHGWSISQRHAIEPAVALKFCQRNWRTSRGARAFPRSTAASALNHPNICTIYDVGELPLATSEGSEVNDHCNGISGRPHA